MKTINEAKETRKIPIIMIFLTLIMATGYGQGLLVEGAAKLFSAIRNTNYSPEYVNVHTSILNADESGGAGFSLNTLVNLSEIAPRELPAVAILNEEFYPNVIASFNVSGLEVSYENEIVTESWMTETFSNELEDSQPLEAWMTESFSNELEDGQAVEPWMTESFSNELENGQAVEPWMTESFSNELEDSEATEAWMTESFSNELEDSEATEAWMTNRFYKELEPMIEVENWMTIPVFSAVEETNEVEEWMTQPLI